MPEVMDAPVDVEPTDKRTSAWKEWKARQEAGAEVRVAPVTRIPSRFKVMPPDEFALNFCTRDIAGVKEYQKQPNFEAVLADHILKAYTAYLVVTVPKYRDRYLAAHPDVKHVAHPEALWAEFDAATQV